MELTAEQLESIEEMAGLFFTLEEIAAFIEVKPIPFVMEYQTKGPVWIAYNKGKLIAMVELRQRLKELSDQGSTPAQQAILKMIENQTNAQP